MHDEYLGDGVYASWDGWHVWLDLRAQDPTIRIALEPSVLRSLNKFADACYRMEFEKQQQEEKGG